MVTLEQAVGEHFTETKKFEKRSDYAYLQPWLLKIRLVLLKKALKFVKVL